METVESPTVGDFSEQWELMSSSIIDAISIIIVVTICWILFFSGYGRWWRGDALSNMWDYFSQERRLWLDEVQYV